MIPLQAVTLVSSGGTPSQLADQRGAPYPTTGFGALVFNTGPHLIDAVLENSVLGGPIKLIPGDFFNPSIQFTLDGTRTPGFYSEGPGNISLVGTDGTEASRALLASFNHPGNLIIPQFVTANGTIPSNENSQILATTAWVNNAIATSPSGTVTSVSVVTANGLAGTVATPASTPAITLSTTITGMLKGNGTAISAGVPGTDYVTPGGVPITLPPSGPAGGDLVGTYPTPFIKPSVALTGTPTAPTATPSTTSTTQIATTAFVQSALPTTLPGPPTGVAGGHLAGTYPNPTIKPGTNTQVLTTVGGVATWAAPTGGGGGASTVVSLTPPVAPTVGQLWFCSDSIAGGGQTYLWFDDGTSAQWVPVTPISASSSGGGGSSGDVVGPATSTDNAVTRYDGTTGKLIQNSNAILDDDGILTVVQGHIRARSPDNTTGVDIYYPGSISVFGNDPYYDLWNNIAAANQRYWITAYAQPDGSLAMGAYADDYAEQATWTYRRDGSTTLPGLLTGTTATFSSAVNAASEVVAGTPGGGYIKMNGVGADPTHVGLLSFHTGDNVRQGYIGYGAGGIQYAAEVGYHDIYSSGGGRHNLAAGLTRTFSPDWTNTIDITAGNNTASFISTKAASTLNLGGNNTNQLVLAPTVITANLPLAGTTATFNGGVVNINGAAGTYRQFTFQTNGVYRWTMGGADNVAESGGNVGSNFNIHRFDDTGGYLGAIFHINRASGVATFNGPLAVGGALTGVNAAFSDSSGNTQILQVTGTGVNGAGIKLMGNSVGSAPAKWLRSINGQFDIINNAYSAPLLIITDAGVGTMGASPAAASNNTEIATTAWVRANSGGAPPGAIMDYAGATAPTGWLLCNGASYLRTDYPSLFAAIGVVYGSVDGTHFNVPDLGGRVTAGKEVTATRLTFGATLGATGGAQNHALTWVETGAHYHNITTGSHGHVVNPGLSTMLANAGNQWDFTVVAGTTGQSGYTGYTSGSTDVAGNLGGTTDTQGSGTAHNNTQPTIIVNKIIKT